MNVGNIFNNSPMWELRAMWCARARMTEHISLKFLNKTTGRALVISPGPCGLIKDILHPAIYFPLSHELRLLYYRCYDVVDLSIVWQDQAWLVCDDDHGEWFLATDCQTPVSGSLHATLSLHWLHHAGLQTLCIISGGEKIDCFNFFSLESITVLDGLWSPFFLTTR